MSSHYDLASLRGQPRRADTLPIDLNLIMIRLNALEEYAGQNKSTWYGKDSLTGVTYGAPYLMEMVHYRINYNQAPYRAYIRDRVNQLRDIIGAPAFPWEHTPSIDDYDNEPHRRCSLGYRQFVEMLQSIGREYGGSVSSPLYVTRYRETLDGVVTEWEMPASRIAYASYYLAEHSSARVVGYGNARWSYRTLYGTQSEEVDEYELKTYGVSGNQIESLQTFSQEIIGYSVPSTQATLHLKNNSTYDWVETEGGAYVMVLNSGDGTETSGGTETKSGNYQYNGTVSYIKQASCSGARHRVGEGLETVIIDLEQIAESPRTVLGNEYASFTPEFTVGSDGSVYPVVPSDLPIGSLSEDESHYETILSELTAFIDEHKSHTTVEHLVSVFDASPHGSQNYGDVDSANGQAEVSAYGDINVVRGVMAEYKRTGTIQNQSGWLLWTAPYIPENYTERLAI